MILGFMHCYTVGPWQDIINEQVQKIKKSGLWDITQKIHVGLLGQEPYHITDDKFQIHYGGEPKKYEGYTLDILQNTCKNEDYAWYTHTKGVTQDYDPHIYKCVSNWRCLLEYYVIEHYRGCLRSLTEYDIAGALWQNTPPHFSGNIWWATGKYITTLPNVIPWAKEANGYPERYQYEFWIGSKPCRALNFYTLPPYSEYNPYRQDVGNSYRKRKIY